MKYKAGQAVQYLPKKTVGYIRRVNNRPDVFSDSQRNYLVEVDGYLVTVYEDDADKYLSDKLPAKPKPPLQQVTNTTGQTLPNVNSGWFNWLRRKR